MKGLPFVLLFTAMTFVAWGAYGPVLHHGTDALGHDSLRAFVGVGLAYFLIAVLIPVAMLKRKSENGKWTIAGTLFSLVAGAVGAIGALGVILALGYGGKPVYVMPLVFGFAPVVNTLVTAALSRTFSQISPIFIGGIIAAALGAGGVLVFKPTAPAANMHVAATEATSDPATATKPASEVAEPESEASGVTAESEGTHSVEPTASGDETAAEATEAAEKPKNTMGIILSIVVAALCWGAYGPVLHIGQGRMAGSRLRPFACVGAAYFLIAVAVPLALIMSRSPDTGAWTASGMTWSFLAGVAGAVGALGVILAFNSGGKPYYVMPLIFGFAPVVNTSISLSEAGTWSLVRIEFWISLAIVIAGAVTVLTNAPKPKKPVESPAK